MNRNQTIANAGIIFLLAVIVLFSSAASAGTAQKSVEDILNDIMAKQGVTALSNIDCSKVSASDFEELGDAVMERIVGNRELHERMDQMMGGEGSESLRRMHTVMGMNWLGCGGAIGPGKGMNPMMPMMIRMMGNYYPAYYVDYNNTLILGALGWFLFAVVLADVLARPRRNK